MQPQPRPQLGESERIAAEQRRLQLRIGEQNRALRERQEKLLNTLEQLQAREAEAVQLALAEQDKARELAAALTELRDTQERLIRNEKLAAVGQLAASVGHDLRNPLGAIRNAWYLIEKRLKAHGLTETEPRLAGMAKVINNEIDRCAKIIGDLLDFSRERPLHRVPVEIKTLVADAVGVVAVPAPTIQLVNAVEDGLPAAYLDVDQFRQVLVNLCQNAVEAVDAKTGAVFVECEFADSLFRLTVSDNGSGIPPEMRERIFEPLFTSKLRGTGLGLAIVANILRRHGGSITVDSEVGQGTTFTLTFPAGEPSFSSTMAEGGAADFRK